MKRVKKFVACLLGVLSTLVLTNAFFACETTEKIPEQNNGQVETPAPEKPNDDEDCIEHAWGEWTETVAPTCMVEGKEQRVCANNAEHVEKRTKEIVADNHSWGDWTEMEATTCTTEGKEQRVCANNPEHIEERTKETVADNHSWKEWTETLAPTCATEGKEQRVCANNPEHIEERAKETVADNHSWKEWTETLAPTCMVEGKEQRVCANNAKHVEKRAKEIVADNHFWKEWTETVAPTCTVEGKEQRVCANNAEHVEERAKEIVAYNHSWGDWAETVAPTCKVEGTLQRVCKNNSVHVEEQSIPKTQEHTLGDLGACSVCGKQLNAMAVSVSVAPTVSTIYYGETPTVSGGKVVAENGATVSGKWTIQADTFVGSGENLIVNSSKKATAVFKPNDTSLYQETTTTVDVPMYAVASYGSVYYSTLDDALAAANEKKSGTVYALPSDYTTETGRAVLAKTIRTTTEIKAGVTLAVPYEGTNVYATVDEAISNLAFATPTTYLRNNITLGKNVVLTNNGYIQIGGVISGGGSQKPYSSFTGSYYGQLTLESGSKILNQSGTSSAYGIQCYGYITEKTEGCSEGIVSRGTLLAPFTILEHHGGSAYFGISGLGKTDLIGVVLGGVTAKPEITPFNKFYAPNITTLLKIEKGTMYAHVDLYANSQHNITTISLIGYSSSCLIELKGESYLFADLNASTQITKLDIYGDAALNGMSLTLNVTYSSITAKISLSTEKALFPISWLYNVRLHAIGGGSTVSLNQDVKILPGGSLVVDEGVTVKANRLTVYGQDMERTRGTAEGTTLVVESYDKKYPHNGKTIPSGELIVNGTLVVSQLGGFLESENIGATLQMSVANTVVGKELDYVVGSGLDAKASYFTVSEVATLYFDDGTAVNLQESVALGEYIFNGEGWEKGAEKLTITFKLGNGEADVVRYVEPNTEFVFDFNDPTRSGYTFNGWKLTSGSGELKNNSFVVKEENVVLEAQWKKNSCLVEGTLITLFDGSQKKVEEITAQDELLVFNHETGKYEKGTLWFNDHADQPAELTSVINLEFSNGTLSRICYEHAFFDLDLNRYVFINEQTMNEYIGHRFVAVNSEGNAFLNEETVLVNAYITEEIVKVYGPITEYHFNLVADNLLSMPSFNFDVKGFINIFEYDKDLRYDEEKMQADIAEYGLFTYEDFESVMSYQDYKKTPIKYFKVSIGKGYLTYEEIELTLQYLFENGFAG